MCGEVVVLCFDGSIRGSGCDCQFWNISKRDINLTCYCLPHAVAAGDCWYGWCYCSPCLLNFVSNASVDQLCHLFSHSGTLAFLPFIHVCPSAEAAFSRFSFDLDCLSINASISTLKRRVTFKKKYVCIYKNVLYPSSEKKRLHLIPFGEINEPNVYFGCYSVPQITISSSLFFSTINLANSLHKLCICEVSFVIINSRPWSPFPNVPVKTVLFTKLHVPSDCGNHEWHAFFKKSL